MFSSTTSPTVTVLVSEKKCVYTIDKDVLIKASPFFKSCLTIGMAEQQNNEIELPEDSCEAFDILVGWMHDNKVSAIKNDDGVERAILAWVLADKYSMPFLQNTIIDQLGEYKPKKKRLNPEHVRFAIEEAGADSIMGCFFIDMLAGVMVCNDEEDPDDLEPQWLVKLDNFLAAGKVPSRLLWKIKGYCLYYDSGEEYNPCEYHVHRPGRRCARPKE